MKINHVEKGSLKQKFDTRQLGNTKKFRQFLLDADGEIIRFTCSQSMCSLLDNFNIGDLISVKFSIKTENILYCEHIRHDVPTA